MDEAGTSSVEPVSVVVGLIADADNHVMTGEALMSESLRSLPAAVRQDFVFHATDIYAGGKHRDQWSLTDRIEFLKDIMSIPRRIGMAISVSAKWRGTTSYPDNSTALNLSAAQLDHLMAFLGCIGLADRNIRKHAGPREVAAIVAEDVPDLRRHLRIVLDSLRNGGLHLAPGDFRMTASDVEVGYLTQTGSLNVTRIRNTIHFVEKADDLLVQVADACAYGLRRYFAGEKFGEDFARQILGGNYERLRNFAAPGGTECYWPIHPG